MTTTTLTTSTSNLTITTPETLVIDNGVTLSHSLNDSTVTTKKGGVTDNLTVNLQSTENVGGKSYDTLLYDYSNQNVLSGGIATGTEIGQGSQQIVSAGAIANGSLIDGPYVADGLIVDADGTANDPSINGANTTVQNSGVINKGTLLQGSLDVLSGGSTNEMQIASVTNGFISVEYVDSGATDTSSTILNGGLELVYAGGRAFSTVIDAGGRDGVYGTLSSAIDNGTLGVGDAAGALISGATINNAALLTVYATGTASGVVVNNGGTVIAQSGSTIQSALINGGTIVAESGVNIKGEITFGSSGGTLTNSGTHNLTIAGFTSGDEIFLSATTIPKSRHVTLNSKGVLTIGSIKETFVHGAGMILNLTSTGSSVEISEKKSCSDMSAVVSCKASPESAASTISFDGIAYTIAEDGVLLNSGIATIKAGSAAVSMSVVGHAYLYVERGAISDQSNVHGGFAREFDYGISLNDTIGNGIPEGGFLYVYGTALYTDVIIGTMYGEKGSSIYKATIGRYTVLKESFGSNATLVTVNGISDVYGVDNKAVVNFREVIESGGITNAGTVNNKGILLGLAGGRINNALANLGGGITLRPAADISGVTLNGGTMSMQSGSTAQGKIVIEDDGSVNIDSGATIKSEIDFLGGGNVTNSNAHNLTIAGFTPGDEVFLSGTSIPKSRHVTLNSKGVLTIGSIKETFVHGAGMVLNLTSTSSGVEITDKISSADTGAISSSNASPEIFANLWNDPKMEFIGTALADEPLGETHLDKTSFAALCGDDFKATDIIGLKGAASSELTLTHPTISAGAQITTLPLQNSILSIATFGLG